jgi:hypothetical protein
VAFEGSDVVAVLDLEEDEAGVFVFNSHPKLEKEGIFGVIGIGGAGEEGPVVKEAPVGEAAVLADFKGTGADAAEGHPGARKLRTMHRGVNRHSALLEVIFEREPEGDEVGNSGMSHE